jgi:hypothetical protein
MFGDLFSQRIDNETGILYSSRRRYLYNNSFEPPPEFRTRKMARRRLKQALDGDLSISSDNIDERDSIMASFLQPMKRSSLDSNASKKFKKAAKLVMDTVGLVEVEPVKREDWREEQKAGVKYYVNKITGEVQVDCPWRVNNTMHNNNNNNGLSAASNLTTIAASRKPFNLAATNSLNNSSNNNKSTSKLRKFTLKKMEIDTVAERPYEEEVLEGTGSIVFQESKDADSLFKLLDSIK